MKPKNELFWWVAAGVMALALVAQFVIYRSDTITASNHASWTFHPQSFADVAAQAETIVEGEVVKIEAGPPLVIKAAGEPNGQDSVPTERVTIRVGSSAKGATSAGQELVVFRTGGQVTLPTGPPSTGAVDPGRGHERLDEPAGGKGPPDAKQTAPQRPQTADPGAPADANVQVFLLDEDPAYQVGQRVFLALESGPEGIMRPVSPEGRYVVSGDGTLQSIIDTPVGASVNGRTLAEAQAAAQGLLTIPSSGDATAPPTDAQKRVAPGMPTTGQPTLLWLMLGGMAVVLFGIGLVLRRLRA